MSTNDGNHNSNDATKASQAAQYYASVYRYTCVGHVKASQHAPTDDRVCRGIHYNLQQAAESQRLVTREEAVRDFSLLNGSGKQHHHSGFPPSLQEKMETEAIIVDSNDKEDSWKEVDCFGVTQVEVLVLEEGEKKESLVTGVAPHVMFGTSVKDAGTQDGSTVNGTLHLGALEISVSGGLEEPSKDKQQESSPHRQQQQQSNNKNPQPHHPEHTTAPLDLVELSKKMAQNMTRGAGILRDAVQEDFPSRMVDASSRVLYQMNKTVDRTGKVCKGIYRVWFNDDGSDDNDRHEK